MRLYSAVILMTDSKTHLNFKSRRGTAFLLRHPIHFSHRIFKKNPYKNRFYEQIHYLLVDAMKRGCSRLYLRRYLVKSFCNSLSMERCKINPLLSIN